MRLRTKNSLLCYGLSLMGLILLLSHCLIPIYGNQQNYFKRFKTKGIKLGKEDVLSQLWLKRETPLQIHHYNVENKDQIPQLMAQRHKITISDVANIPAYNSFQSSSLNYYFKKPETALLGAYLKPRPNPFDKHYQAADYQYNLKDFQKLPLLIKDIYGFFDISKRPIDQNVKVHYIKAEIDTNKTSFNAFISDYLLNHRLTNQRVHVSDHSYNLLPHQGLVAPLSKHLQQQDIKGIYYDDGYRLLENKQADTNYMLKGANGAKNIYLFKLTPKKKAKTIHNITLNPGLNPEQKLKDWLNTLNANLKITNTHAEKYRQNVGQYIPNFGWVPNHKQRINLNLSLLKTFEDDNNIYHVNAPYLHAFTWYYPEDIKSQNKTSAHVTTKIDQTIFEFITEELKTRQGFIIDSQHGLSYQFNSFKIVYLGDYLNEGYVEFPLRNNKNPKYPLHIILKLDKQKTFQEKLTPKYQQALTNWQQQACFKPKIPYYGQDIWNKIRYNRIYTPNQNYIYSLVGWFGTEYDGFSYEPIPTTVNNHTYYSFQVTPNTTQGWWSTYQDGIKLEGYSYRPISGWLRVILHDYYDDTPPPRPPSIKDL